MQNVFGAEVPNFAHSETTAKKKKKKKEKKHMKEKEIEEAGNHETMIKIRTMRDEKRSENNKWAKKSTEKMMPPSAHKQIDAGQ